MAKRPKPPLTLSGITAEFWRSDSTRVAWAQKSAEFREILAALTNERTAALATGAPVTENRLLGRVEGYETALAILDSLATGTPPATPGPLDVDYGASASDDANLNEAPHD